MEKLLSVEAQKMRSGESSRGGFESPASSYGIHVAGADEQSLLMLPAAAVNVRRGFVSCLVGKKETLRWANRQTLDDDTLIQTVSTNAIDVCIPSNRNS